LKITLAHIINPYKAPEGSENAIAQPISLLSIQNAVKHKSDKYSIELYAAIIKGDEDLVPEGFKILYLNRTLTEVANFKAARPLPLIGDIIQLLLNNSTADYFVYTNIDIGLQPYFYEKVSAEIESGYDSLVINRRGIPDQFNSVVQMDEIYKQAGKDHPGYDCFVFKRSIAEKFIFKNICLGIPRFERTFVLNLICFSQKTHFLEKEILTFHIGETIYKTWGDQQHLQHNQSEYLKIRKELFGSLLITKFPYWTDNVFLRYWKWIWNPNFSFPDNFLLEWRYRLKGH